MSNPTLEDYVSTGIRNAVRHILVIGLFVAACADDPLSFDSATLYSGGVRNSQEYESKVHTFFDFQLQGNKTLKGELLADTVASHLLAEVEANVTPVNPNSSGWSRPA